MIAQNEQTVLTASRNANDQLIYKNTEENRFGYNFSSEFSKFSGKKIKFR